MFFLLGPDEPSLKSAWFFFRFFFSFFYVCTIETLIGRKSAILDVDWSPKFTLETLIGSRAVCESLSWRIDEEIRIRVLACQVGPFHLKLTQINSEMTPNRPRFRLVHRLHKSSVQQKLQDLRGADVEEMRAKVCKLARKSDMNYKFYCFTIITGVSQ